MRWAGILVAMVCVLNPTGARSETKALGELDALKIEKSEAVYQMLQAEVRALQERAERVKDQTIRYIQDVARGQGTEGWKLNLPERRWEKPDVKSQEDSNEPRR